MPNESALRPLTLTDRRRLQAAFESANALIRQGASDRRRIHGLFSLCVAGDRCNALYVSAFLDNLDQMAKAAGVSGWLAQWQTPRGALREALSRGNWGDATRIAVSILDRVGPDVEALSALATIAEADEASELAWIYWHFVASKFADCEEAIERGAAALDQLGRFEEAGEWRQRTVVKSLPPKQPPQAEASPADKSRAEDETVREVSAWDAHEVIRRAGTLIAAGALDEAESLLSKSMMSLGNDFRLRESWEELQLARSRTRAQAAADRFAAEATAENARLAKSLEEERRRLEIHVLDSRCQRYPSRIDLRVELIQQLRAAERFPEVLRQVELLRKRVGSPGAQPADVPSDLFWRLALLEGESWQGLKVFAKAVKAYGAGLEKVPSEPLSGSEPWLGLLHRKGVLSAAMGDVAGARRDFEALLAISPDYKDVRQRLDNLP